LVHAHNASAVSVTTDSPRPMRVAYRQSLTHAPLLHVNDAVPPSQSGGGRPAGQSESSTHVPFFVHVELLQVTPGAHRSRQYICTEGPHPPSSPNWPLHARPSPGRQAPSCSCCAPETQSTQLLPYVTP